MSGCGINLSNSKPTTSVNELIALHNARTGSNLQPIEPETLLAAVLRQLDRMWPTFTDQGFEPFVDQYLRRWIHSCVRWRQC